MTVKKIRVLDPQVANKIAAGEVVERPASVVKELVENSLDAGSTAVTIEIREGGTEYIRITDNGCGIANEDVKTAFLRHATSKLQNAEGLDAIETLGFRGEALASVAAVAKVSMRTHTEFEDSGTLISLEGGVVKEYQPCGCPTGTTVEIRELFFNVPARLKFLKSSRAEAAAVGDYVLRLILGNTDVSFKFINNGKPVYHSAGDGSLENALICVYGADAAEHIKPVRYDDGYLYIEGFCGDEFLSRSNRNQQSVFVNGRYIRSPQISYAAQRAYNTRLMVGKFPFFALNIGISPREVDVNVHPNKLSVRFRDEERIQSAVTLAIRDALEGKSSIEESNPATFAEPAKAEDVYSVFRREERSPDHKPAFEPAPNFKPEPVIPYEKNDAKELAPKTDPSEAPKIKLPGDDEGVLICMRDSASSAPAVETADVNGVVHYTFPEPVSNETVKEEAITFDLNPYSIIGTAFDTYIIVEQGDSVFYIDQHAAHERILYEKLIKDELKFDSQILLTPKILQLSPVEYQVLTENIERFRELGFELEEFGSVSVSISAVPFGVKKESIEKLVSEMIEIIRKQGTVKELDILRSSLIRSSCKHAVKAGQMLDKHGIEEILSHYADGSTPLTCPHGRPVMVRISRRDLEKLFKRIT